MNRSDKPTASTQRRERSSKGTTRDKPANGHTEPQKLSVKSVLIEPRENEPPRVSVSVEYEGKAPNLKQLKKLAVDVAHDVVSVEAYVDLGYRAGMQQRTLVQVFECREKGEGGG